MKKILCSFVMLFLAASPVYAKVSADHSQGGAIILGQTSDACDAAQSQALRWNSDTNTVEMCDGNGAWRRIISTTGNDMPAAPASEIGYFVLSAGYYDGNMGGISGANNICLNELTTHDWKGKADAQARGILNSHHVKAWLCANNICQDLNAWQEYAFAVANDPVKGGARISVEEDALTHNNTQNWSGENYWGAAYYFTGRIVGTATKFGTAGTSNCSSWTTNSSTGSIYAPHGVSFTNDSKRWMMDNGAGLCPRPQRIVCMVHP